MERILKIIYRLGLIVIWGVAIGFMTLWGGAIWGTDVDLKFHVIAVLVIGVLAIAVHLAWRWVLGQSK